MDNLNGKSFIKMLKTIDIDPGDLTSESVDWIFYKQSKDMLFWLCRYIDEDNVESAQELYEKELLQKKGKFFAGDKYDHKVNEISEEHPGLFDIIVDEVNILEKELEREEYRGKNLDNLSTKYLGLDYKIQNQISKLERESLNTHVKLEESVKDCLEISQNIDKVNEQIQENIKEYIDILLKYPKNANEKYFISQMPLDYYKQEDENVESCLHLWIEQEFDVNEAVRSVKSFQSANKNDSEPFILGREFERVYDDLQDSIMNRIRAECSVTELESVIDYIEKNSSLCIHETEQRMKEIEISSNINSLAEEFNRICDIELQQAIEKFCRHLINNVLSNQAKLKRNKCRKIISKLKNLHNKVTRTNSQNLLMGLLHKVEKQKLETLHKFISNSYFSLTKNQQEIKEKYDIMNIFETIYLNYEETPIEQRETVVNDFLSLVTGDYKNKNTSIIDALRAVQQKETTIENLEHELFTYQYQDSMKTMTEVEKKIKEMKAIIWCGPTMQPVAVPYPFIDKLFESTVNIEKVVKKLEKCMQVYIDTQETFSNRWLKNKKLMFVWFLTEPKRILEELSKIMKFISQSQQTKPQACAKLVDI